MNKKNTCLSCGEEITGRSDKKFCNIYCKSSYHNKTLSPDEQTINNTNKVLRKNRSILKKYNPIGKTTIKASIIEKEGFDFRFFTHIYQTKDKIQYHFCYDYGCMMLPDDNILIVNWQPYMKNNIVSFRNTII